MGYIINEPVIKGKLTNLKVVPDTNQGVYRHGKFKSYLAPLGLVVVGALLGIGHFGGLHESIFGTDNESEQIIESNYDYSDSYSTEYSNEVSFRGSDRKFVKTSYGCNECSCSGYWGYKHTKWYL